MCLCVRVGGSYSLMMVARGKRGEGADRTGNGSEAQTEPGQVSLCSTCTSLSAGGSFHTQTEREKKRGLNLLMLGSAIVRVFSFPFFFI